MVKIDTSLTGLPVIQEEQMNTIWLRSKWILSDGGANEFYLTEEQMNTDWGVNEYYLTEEQMNTIWVQYRCWYHL